MGNIQKIDIKNGTYYFFSGIVNIEDFNPVLLKHRQEVVQKNIDVLYFGYITIKNISDCENNISVNPLYFIVGKTDGHLEEKK